MKDKELEAVEYLAGRTEGGVERSWLATFAFSSLGGVLGYSVDKP